MVGFGAVLERSRRPVWGTAYLDYEGLKSILYKLEVAVVENSARLSFQPQDLTPDFPDVIDEDVRRYSTEFMSKLHSEIEKVTLFCLSRLGDLAHSLGALRFDTDTHAYPDEDHDVDDVECAKKTGAVAEGAEENTKRTTNHRGINLNDPGERDSLLTVADGAEEIMKRTTNHGGFNPNDPGERHPLLTTTGSRSYIGMSPSPMMVANLFHREDLDTLIGSRSNDVDDKFGVYANIGVELLHLLKFSCMNAVGVRSYLIMVCRWTYIHKLRSNRPLLVHIVSR
jgi:hypothetical protein